MRTGVANLPLHPGKCPSWLFGLMKALGTAIIQVIVEEYGPEEVLRRLSDPVWFQAFGSVLGFDWHSSGLTTTVCAALKEGLAPRQGELGLFLAGGKGKTSRQTPHEIDLACEKFGLPSTLEDLKYASKMAAKVDSAAVQDGYQIYHHFFVFLKDGSWSVVQQGLNDQTGWARRYHWLSSGLTDFVCEPHAAVCGSRSVNVLNMVAQENDQARDAVAFLSREKPESILKEIKKITESQSFKTLDLPYRHSIPSSSHINRVLLNTYQNQPADFEKLLSATNAGPATIRALALVAEVAYGVNLSFRDPVRYSFAHGGKDGIPYPVDRPNYQKSISSLENALRRAKTGDTLKLKALRRLSHIARETGLLTQTNMDGESK